MAKSKKDKSKKALSNGRLFSQEAVSELLFKFGKHPDLDNVLRKAGINRTQLGVMLDDDEIAQAAETRLDALLAEQMRLEPSDTPQAVVLKKELDTWFHEIVTAAHNALWFGYSVQEAVYNNSVDENIGEYIGLREIVEKPFEWFEPKNDGRLIYRQDGIAHETEVDQQFKFFLTVRKPSYKQPYGKPLLATLYWLWFFKTNGWKFWAKFLERFGTPILLGRVSNGDEESMQDMLNALLNAHAQSVIAINMEDSVEVLSTPNGSASFDNFNTVIMRQIQKVILGQTLTSGTDGKGSYALGEVHNEVRRDKLKSDIRLVLPTLQNIVNALCELNGWEYHKVIVGEERSLNKEQAERDAILANFGVKFSKDYIVNNYGFRDSDIETAGGNTTEDMPKFSAINQQPFSFADQVKKITPQQKELERLIDEPQQFSLLDNRQLRDLIGKSQDTESLIKNLSAYIPQATQQEFSANLERALFAAEIIGYVHAQEGK